MGLVDRDRHFMFRGCIGKTIIAKFAGYGLPNTRLQWEKPALPLQMPDLTFQVKHRQKAYARPDL